MVRVLPEIDYPKALLPYMKAFGADLPKNVRWNAEMRAVEVTEDMPLEVRVSMAYLNLVGDVQDVMDNIELVLKDLLSLSVHPPEDAQEGERRYFLLTKLFFYELLRIRDAIPRFLKRLEEHGLMSKEERHSTKKLLEQQLSEHYLIRNVYLHGHSLPKSDQEHDLSLISLLGKYGYEPELVSRARGESKRYPDLLQELAVNRREGLKKIASDMAAFCQNIINFTAEWVHHHHFGPEREP
jgi:hypothetical protein